MLSMLAAAAVLFQASAPAPPAPAPRPSVITRPDWVRKPTGEDLADLYPKAAADKNLEGQATIRCQVSAAGDLENCRTIEESPPLEGFGDAALAMASKFKMKPMSKDGAPVGGALVNIPIRFRLPQEDRQDAVPTADFALRCYGFSAAAAEKDPSSGKAQTGAFLWGVVSELFASKERIRPSELDARLLAARRLAEAPGASDEAGQADRRQCDAMVEAAEPGLQKLFDALPH
jgi:TonB family protein